MASRGQLGYIALLNGSDPPLTMGLQLDRARYPVARHGLFRTALLGHDAPLSAAFEALYRALHEQGHLLTATAFGAHVPSGDADDCWEMISLQQGNIYVVIADCHYRHERSETVHGESFIEFHFTLTGSAVASWPQAPMAPSGDLDLVICHLGNQARYQITCTPGRRRSVAIYVRRPAFERYLDPASPAGRNVIAELARIKPCELYFNRVPIAPPYAALVTQLLTNPYQDCRRWLYAEAKVSELLCSVIELWQQTRPGNGALTLSPRDIRCLHDARRILLADLAEAHTIPELANEVGINTAKLKAGFRLLFGCSVYECLQRARMNQALEWLYQGIAVQQIAHDLGYQHLSSFSSAFTRHFGHSPRQVRHPMTGQIHSSAAVIAT